MKWKKQTLNIYFSWLNDLISGDTAWPQEYHVAKIAYSEDTGQKLVPFFHFSDSQIVYSDSSWDNNYSSVIFI